MALRKKAARSRSFFVAFAPPAIGATLLVGCTTALGSWRDSASTYTHCLASSGAVDFRRSVPTKFFGRHVDAVDRGGTKHLDSPPNFSYRSSIE